jgi:hypothetical protein
MEILYVYSKQRKEFGRAAKFVDLNADILAETVPNPDQVRMQPLPFRFFFFQSSPSFYYRGICSVLTVHQE